MNGMDRLLTDIALVQLVTELRAWQLKACALLGIAYPEDIDTLTPKPEPEYPASDLTCEHCGLDEVASNHECEARP